jgi:hypothetical protein
MQNEQDRLIIPRSEVPIEKRVQISRKLESGEMAYWLEKGLPLEGHYPKNSGSLMVGFRHWRNGPDQSS